MIDRRSFIGGSDAAAVLGMSRWRTPLDVWIEKTSVDPMPDTASEPMRWGSRLEPVIADDYAARHSVRLIESPSIVHPDYPMISGTPDRLIVDADGQPIAGLEIKTSSRYDDWGADGTDEIPTEYLLQCQQYMAVVPVDIWRVAVLLGGNRLREYVVRRNERLIDAMIAREVAWWEAHVVSRVPPPGDSQPDIRWMRDAGSTIEADAATSARIELLARLRGEATAIAAAIEEEEAAVKAYMRDASTLTIGDAVAVTWKTQLALRVDVAAVRKRYPEIAAQCLRETTSRVFRLKIKSGGHDDDE